MATWVAGVDGCKTGWVVVLHDSARNTFAARLVPGSFGRVVYDTKDAVRRKLSDHCPVSVRIRAPAPAK